MNHQDFYLSSVRITHLFGSKQLLWELFTDVNILGGKNGSGKSTILKICHALLKEGYIADSKLAGLVHAMQINFTNGYVLTWERISVRSMDYKQQDGFRYYWEPKGVDNKGYLMLQMSQLKNAAGTPVPWEEAEGRINVLLINSFEQRLLSKENMPQIEDANDRTYLDWLIHEEVFKRNSIFTGVLEKVIKGISTDPSASVESLLQQKNIKNFLSFYSTLQVFMENYSVLPDNQIKFRLKDGAQPVIPYNNLSMGEKQLVLLLLMVANTKGEPCIFFMDEPDLGMHVEWKEILVSQMRTLNPNMQIILSTHAPSMIEGWYEKVKEIGQIVK